MCAKKDQLIKETKEHIQEMHDAVNEKLDECMALIHPPKVKHHAIPR